ISASNNDGGAHILTGRGDGTFEKAGFLDHDGIVNVAVLPLVGPDDVVVVTTAATASGDTARFWRQGSEGWGEVSVGAPDVQASAAWVGDFDGDGDADLVLA